MKEGNRQRLGIYIHIPFCVQKCNYCDFLSFSADEDMKERYVKVLCEEIGQYGEENLCSEQPAQINDFSQAAPLPYNVDSIFIGGGTPSLLSERQIFRILEQVRKKFFLSKDCEITIEANPKTLTEEKLRGYREAGVNRLSLGVQSMDDEILARLGRIHRKDDFLQNYEAARKAGFRNINTDLMFSLPGQTEESWERTLSQILDLEPEHISFYSLIIEEGTPFYEAWKQGDLEEVEDELDRRIYWNTVDKLAENGYDQYEISNAARPGFASRHNLKYWSMMPYLGFGLGAHSYINRKREENTSALNVYLEAMQNPDFQNMQKPPFHFVTTENGVKEEMEEFVFLGLRKTAGIEIIGFFNRFSKSVFEIYGDVISKNKREGLLSEEKGRLFLTRKGVDISNYVMMQFLLDDPT